MKYSIIEDIYNGNRGQYDSIRASNEGIKLSNQFSAMYDNLQKILNDGQKEEVDNLLNKQSDMEAESAFVYFKEGLKIGLLLFAECLTD